MVGRAVYSTGDSNSKMVRKPGKAPPLQKEELLEAILSVVDEKYVGEE